MTGNPKILAKNRRARFDYELIDEYVAGVELYGHEAKSLRTGNGSLVGSYVALTGNEAWLIGSHIKKYPHAGSLTEYDPDRSRKLLLNRSELDRLLAARQNKLTVVALAYEARGRYIKVRIATAKGKKKSDKRQAIKRRDAARDTARELRRG